MKDLVVIKSFTSGITLFINSDCDFAEVIDDIKVKFDDAKNFFGNSKMALTFEGRILSNDEKIQVVDAIKSVCGVKILCIVEHDEDTEKQFVRALEQVEDKFDENAGQFYKGTLKDGDVLETENSIVVLGDVYPGCAVISAKNIIIIGGLYGEAYAGGNGNNSAYVVALEMEPERLKVGDFKYKPARQSRWGIQKKIQPKIAFVKNDKVILESLTKDLLDSLS